MRSLPIWFKKHQTTIVFWGLFFGSIISLALPFIVYQLGFASLFSLLPFWYFLDFIQDRTTGRQKRLFIWLIGLGSMLGILYWSVQTMPEKWAYIHGWAATVSLYANYLMFAVMFSLNFLFFGIVWTRLKLNTARKSSFLLLPALWVACELVRSFIFSLILYAPGARIGAFWNFGSLGLAAATTPLGLICRFVGLGGLTFLVVVTGLAIKEALKKEFKPIIIIALILLTGSIFGQLIYQPGTISRLVAYVQTPVSFESVNDQNEFLRQVLDQKTTGDKFDLLVLPEYKDVLKSSQNSELDLLRLIDDNGVIVTSQLVQEPGGWGNQLVVFDKRGDVKSRHDKSFLIPVGEYMPYLHRGLLKLLRQQRALDLNRQNHQIVNNPTPIPAVNVGGLSIGSQICSGAVTPGLYQVQAGEGAEVLTNSASISMFASAPGYQVQSRQFSHFIALANARPFVQSADGGYGFVMNSDGQVVRAEGKLGYGLGSANVELVGRRTVYSLLGEWAQLLSTVGGGLYLVVLILKNRFGAKL